MSWQLHNSPGDYARELFKPSKDSTSLQVCNAKKNSLVLGFGFFVNNIVTGIVLGLFDPLHLTLSTNR